MGTAIVIALAAAAYGGVPASWLWVIAIVGGIAWIMDRVR